MKTWVADVSEKVADQTIVDWTAQQATYCRATGAKYEKGLSFNGKPGQVGIYFNDPTNKEVAP